MTADPSQPMLNGSADCLPDRRMLTRVLTERCREDLTEAIECARREALPAKAFATERLAWACADRLQQIVLDDLRRLWKKEGRSIKDLSDEELTGETLDRLRRLVEADPTRSWPEDLPCKSVSFEALGMALVARNADELRANLRLSELVWSRSCEQWDDGYRSDRGDACPDETDVCLAAEYARDTQRVELILRDDVARSRAAVTAEDIAHDAFVNMFKTYWCAAASKKFKAEGAIRTLMVLIGRRAIYRASKDTHEASLSELVDQIANPTGDEKLSWNVDPERLSIAIERLSAGQRLVIELIYIRGFKPSECAEIMGTGRPYVTTTRDNALVRLREILRPNG